MPDLVQSLQGRDLGHLKIIAMLWGIDLDAPDARTGLPRLASQMLDSELAGEVVSSLPEDVRRALNALIDSDGRLPWAIFTRRFGDVREMGAARRDRERPYEADQAFPAEALWYRGLAARAFFEEGAEPQEYAYVPDDLLFLIPTEVERVKLPMGRPASPAERVLVLPTTDVVLDDACTLLAALRLGLPIDSLMDEFTCGRDSDYPLAPLPLKELLISCGLLDKKGIPLPEPTRAFLEVSRGEALASLVRAWLRSQNFNELKLLPGLLLEGEWQNDPLRGRHAILDYLSTVPGNLPSSLDERPFWSVSSFVAAIQHADPDFQRPAGDYDSWFIRDLANGEYLRGFKNWERVDGELVRFVLGGPLHWLGILDLATPAIKEGQMPSNTAFRFSAWAADLLNLKAPEGFSEGEEKLIARSDGRLDVPQGVPRAVRYQSARFGEWQGKRGSLYRYQLTPASLDRARKQGLRVYHLLALLRKQARNIPPSLVQALENWEAKGSLAKIEDVTILCVKDPDILLALRNSRAARYLAEPLGPVTVVVKPGMAQKVLSTLAEMGYLGELVKKPPE